MQLLPKATIAGDKAPRSRCIALRCLDHGPRATRYGSMIAALGTRHLDLGPRTDHGWVEAAECDFVKAGWVK